MLSFWRVIRASLVLEHARRRRLLRGFRRLARLLHAAPELVVPLRCLGYGRRIEGRYVTADLAVGTDDAVADLAGKDPAETGASLLLDVCRVVPARLLVLEIDDRRFAHHDLGPGRPDVGA